MRRRWIRNFLLVVLALAGLGDRVSAQTLRFHVHRDIDVPDYAYVRIGSLYSDIRFSQSGGFRYTRSRGAGTDFLRDQRRGRIREDGADWPLISTLDLRNRLLLTRNADVDLSLRFRFEHYPLGTQEDRFDIILPEEGIEGNFSMAFRLTPFVQGTVYDRLVYRTDYIDSRGLIDELGGRRYRYLSNLIGVDTDWLPAPGKNVSLSISRYDHWPQTREFRHQERTTWHESVAYSQQWRPWLSGGLRAAFSQTDYAASERADFDTQLYSVFADILITRNVSGSGWIGQSIVTRHAGETEGSGRESGIQWGATLNAEEGFWVGVPQLVHELGATRTVSEGFDTAYVTVDRYRYRMGWNGIALKAGLSVEHSVVEPSDTAVSGYQDTRYGVDASYPLTSFARLNADAGYTLRRNDPPDRRDTAATPPPVDRSADYETLHARLGTAFNVTRSIVFDTWYQYTERFSDQTNLQYSRDVFQAMLTYSHRF